jgi:hypothetical protein
MIPTEFPHLRYEEGSRQAGRPSDPLSLATLPTRLHLATTLRMGALQVESPKCGVCPLISSVGGGVFIEPWGSSTDLEKLVWRQVVADRPGGAASTNFLHHLGLLLFM